MSQRIKDTAVNRVRNTVIQTIKENNLINENDKIVICFNILKVAVSAFEDKLYISIAKGELQEEAK